MGGTATPVTWAPKPRGTPPLLGGHLTPGSQVVKHGFTFPGSSFTDRACGEGKRDKTRNIPERGWGWGPLHCRVPLKQTQATSPRQSRAGKAEKQGKERTGAGKEGSDAQTGSEGAPGGASQNGGRPLPSGVTPKPCSRPAKPLSSSDARARPGSDRYAFPPRPLRRFAWSFRTTSAPPPPRLPQPWSSERGGLRYSRAAQGFAVNTTRRGSRSTIGPSQVLSFRVF